MIIDGDSYPGVLLLRPSGPVTALTIREWLTELDALPAYGAERDAIFDLSDVDLGTVSQAEMRRIVQALRGRAGRGPKRVVYVASGDLDFGVLRMFASLAAMQIPRDRAVFRSAAEALAWLQASRD